MRLLHHGLLVATLIGSCVLGCRVEQGGERASGEGAGNVLLITLDTLRADRLGCYGYAGASTPHLDALAARGLRFTAASTTTPLTLPAHSSLFTGTWPSYHGVRDNGGFYLDPAQVTMAELLATAGLRTGGFVGAFVLDSRWGIGQGFERFFDDFDLTEFADAAGMDAVQRPGDSVVDQALAWLAEERDRPFFGWVHLYDPHAPYEAPEPYRSRFPSTRDGAYDAEVAWTDAQVGRLLKALAADDRLERTLVVVLADHGEMLGEHGELTHGFFVYEGAVRIPLLMAGPGIEPGELHEPSRIVDVLPTILSQLGLPVPAAVQGVDLLSAGPVAERVAIAESWFPRLHYGWSELQSVRDQRYKLIRAPRSELYDLESDPGERNDLSRDQPERVASLGRLLEQHLEETAAPASLAGVAPALRAMDEETRAGLEALGYLGGGRRRHLEEDRGAPSRGDPKDKIQLYNRMKEASAAATLGRPSDAVHLLDAVLDEDPAVVEGHLLRGNFLRQDEQLEQALAAYRRALELDPEYDEALYSLALTYKDVGLLEEARLGFERASSLDPRNGKVLWQLADVLMRLGRFGDAERTLQGALELDLDQPRFLLKLAECQLEQNRPTDAERHLRSAIGQNPGLAGAHFHLGLVHEAQGDPSAAIEAYRSELERHEDAFRAAFHLAKLLQARGELAEAIRLYERAVEIRAGFGTGYLYLAKALLDAGRFDAAEAAAQAGLGQDPDPRFTPLGHFVLADVYNRQGRVEAARREEALGRRLAEAARDLRLPAGGGSEIRD